MNKLLVWVMVLVIGGLVLGAVLPAHAQEATAEAPDTVQIVRDANTTVVELLAAFLSGGVIVGGGVLMGLRSLIQSVDQNPTLKTAIERLYMSTPVDVRRTVREAVEAGKEGFRLADEVTDGVTSQSHR